MIIPFLPSLIKMGRKDSDYLFNLQEDIEKSTFFNQKFGYVGKYGYLCGISYVKFFFRQVPLWRSACFFRPQSIAPIAALGYRPVNWQIHAFGFGFRHAAIVSGRKAPTPSWVAKKPFIALELHQEDLIKVRSKEKDLKNVVGSCEGWRNRLSLRQRILTQVSHLLNLMEIKGYLGMLRDIWGY